MPARSITGTPTAITAGRLKSVERVQPALLGHGRTDRGAEQVGVQEVARRRPG